MAVNGIVKPIQWRCRISFQGCLLRYLKAGSKGFVLGDGGLNYGLENLSELYYSFVLKDNLFLSGAYLFIINPGYNGNRLPVNVLSLRIHTVFSILLQ